MNRHLPTKVNRSGVEAAIGAVIGTVIVGLCLIIWLASTNDVPSPRVTLSSVVKIESSSGWGSGVAIGNYVVDGSHHTLILTAAHVVDADRIVKLHIGAAVYTGYVLKTDKSLDLALIETTHDLPTVPLSKHPRFGDQVWAVGFPIADGEAITGGYLSTEIGGLIEASAPIWPGNSGGALFVFHHGRFELAGIIDSARLLPFGFGVALVSTDEYSVGVAKIRKFLAS